jgi:hypothetical protein
MPKRRRIWFEVSTSEWIASDAIADDWVQPAAMNFATAMPRLHANATKITAFDPPASTLFGLLFWNVSHP